jgi:hypothetical protein
MSIPETIKLIHSLTQNRSEHDNIVAPTLIKDIKHEISGLINHDEQSLSYT